MSRYDDPIRTNDSRNKVSRYTMLGLDVPAWMTDALCAQTDPEAFYPEKGGSTREAKRICMACPVRTECLTYALTTGQRHGIWGGTSPHERTRYLNSGRLPAAAIVRTCERPECGQPFTSERHGARFCSPTCAGIANARRRQDGAA